MELKKIIDALNLVVKTKSVDLEKEVTGGYVSDMLSDVIANCKRGDLWITVQIHQNILAVAILKEMAGIVIIGGKEPAAETLEQAEEENVVILTSPLPAYELASQLYAFGIHGH